MIRAVVNVATDSWVQGQERLIRKLEELGENYRTWTNRLPDNCPPHRSYGDLAAPSNRCVPYAFKAYALREASEICDVLIWADACILPLRSLDPIWEKIERDGYWFSKSGYLNYQWTAEEAYTDLFPGYALSDAIEVNNKLDHVTATAFGINMMHPKGRAFLDEYFRLASETRAFCGPWQNSAAPTVKGRNTGRPAAHCGPPDVLGHRHDQTAASVIAWRLGMELTDPPLYFGYADVNGKVDEAIILLADGHYHTS